MTTTLASIMEMLPNFGLTRELLLDIYFKVELPTNDRQYISLLFPNPI